MFSCWPCRNQGSPTQTAQAEVLEVPIGRLGAGSTRNNRTSTSKYNVITFLPKALFEQYRCDMQGRETQLTVKNMPCKIVVLHDRSCRAMQLVRLHQLVHATLNFSPRRRVANWKFTIVAGLTLTEFSPVR